MEYRRLTTEEPHGNVENMLNIIKIIDCEVYLRNWNGEGDLNLVDYCKAEYKRIYGTELEANAEEFGEYLDGDDLLSLFYATVVGYAELRERLKIFEDNGLSPKQVQEFAKAKTEERLVMLLCKVGDTLYWVAKKRNDHGTHDKHIESSVVIRIWSEGDGYWWITAGGMNRRCDCIGKTIFLTREAADKALEIGGAEK